MDTIKTYKPKKENIEKLLSNKGFIVQKLFVGVSTVTSVAARLETAK